jgi:Protein of unknown function DUF262
MFKESVETLADFCGQASRGFYIPFYQRLYSWDEENARKLLDDVLSGVRKISRKPDHVVFMGSIILHDVSSPRVAHHWDTPNLLTKVSNVVDGQQRISTFGFLACVLAQELDSIQRALTGNVAAHTSLRLLQQNLVDQAVALGDFISVETKKGQASPVKKPKIIRALSATTNPSTDQWTLNGPSTSFYQSDIASILSHFIQHNRLPSPISSDRIAEVIKAFQEVLGKELLDVTMNDCSALMAQNGPSQAMEGFIDSPPDLTLLQQSLSAGDLQTVCQGIFLLAICFFLRKKCHLVVIECGSEDLAFDMFQSLNATGTPLTAFEVFKPAVVNTWGSAYPTGVKSDIDRIEAVFEQEITANKKEEVTDKVICSAALVFNGQIVGARFSEEREWLMKTFVTSASAGLGAQAEIIKCLADTAEYFEHVIKPRRPNKNSATFPLVNHLMSLGLSAADADLAALCLFYLRDANHRMSHSIVGVFYGKLIRAQSNPAAKIAAASDFLCICKAAAAFFTLWMGGGVPSYPDSDYRHLFEATPNASWASGQTNQNVAFVKGRFQAALNREHVYDISSPPNAKQLWTTRASNVPWYQKKAVCKFGLFVAFEDASVDLTAGREGLTVSGLPGCATYLTCNKWYSSDQEVIEHVAVRDKPGNIKYVTHFDANLYPGNYSVVDRIGNLTLLSMPVNSSIYSEWPDKTYYYWALTTPTMQSQGPQGAQLALALGITGGFPPSLGILTAASAYIAHLAPIACRGIRGLQWDKTFVESRSQHLCERIFDRLVQWLV